MATKNNQILVSGGIVFKDYRGKIQYLVTKASEEENWEIPKVTVRRGESSVRAVIRMVGEQAGMNARVLEEAGRSTGVVTVNNKVVSQKYYYYILIQRSVSEIVGFKDYKWLDYPTAVKQVASKKEKDMLKSAREFVIRWEKERKKK